MVQNVLWRSVHGYEGLYEVSNTGMMRSITRTIKLPNGVPRTLQGKILAIKLNNDGYPFASLSKDGRAATVYIHRAVATAFIENPDDLPQVNHLDGNKRNNNVSNLAWVTHQQNVKHCYDTGLCKNKGGNHTFAVGVVDNSIGQEFSTIKEWCAARGINYSTGRNLLAGHNTSKTIDLSAIIKQLKVKVNDQAGE